MKRAAKRATLLPSDSTGSAIAEGSSGRAPNTGHAAHRPSGLVSKQHHKTVEDQRTNLRMAQVAHRKLRTVPERHTLLHTGGPDGGDSVRAPARHRLRRESHNRRPRTHLPIRQTLWIWRARKQSARRTICASCFTDPLSDETHFFAGGVLASSMFNRAFICMLSVAKRSRNPLG
jgi:hypothetical protein